MVSLVLFSFGILISLGFLFGDITVGNSYTFFSNNILWGGVFGAYALAKFTQTLGRIPICIKSLTSVLGLWLWSVLLVSFLLLDIDPMTPAEPIIIVPVLWELSYLIGLIYVYKRVYCYRRRKNDA